MDGVATIDSTDRLAIRQQRMGQIPLNHAETAWLSQNPAHGSEARFLPRLDFKTAALNRSATPPGCCKANARDVRRTVDCDGCLSRALALSPIIGSWDPLVHS